MAVEICTVGGFSEVGRNMTAVRIDDKVILCDMGIHLENYIELSDKNDGTTPLTAEQLIANEALPNITHIEDWKEKVIAIVPTHAHLDHIGAIPYLAPEFPNAEIIATPFTIGVLDRILSDSHITLENQFMKLRANNKMRLTEDITLEFVSITHSTPQTIVIVIHTPYGKICYANDFKLDATPVLGEKTNTKRLEKLGEEGDVICCIMDSLYSREHKKTPSESVAREMLKDVMLNSKSDGKAVIVTTFSSHISRLKSIVEFGKKLNRKVIFLGRSLDKYVSAAEDAGIIDFSEVEKVRYGSKVKPRLNQIVRDGREKYVLVVTGHQAEPNATLTKMINGTFPFNPGDHVIISSTTIPVPDNIANRKALEERMKQKKVRLFTDIHVSGHGAREDQRQFLELLKPQHIIPAHGDRSVTSPLLDLALEMDYSESQVHLMENGLRLSLG